MSAKTLHADDSVPLEILRQIDAVCDEFEGALKRGGGLAIGPYLARVENQGRDLLVKELALLALDHLRKEGSSNPLADLLQANPELRGELNRVTQTLGGAPTIHMSSG